MTDFWQKLKKPFTVLAPMENITDMAFREMVAVNFPRPDVFFTEFVNADAIIHGVTDSLRYSENQRPVVAQIWGTNLSSLEKASNIVEGMGFDGIDINMGCPARDVVRAGGGAALIKVPQLAVKIINAVQKGVTKIPVSVKTRLGMDFKSILETGISALTIHGRTLSQMSKGKADWGKIGDVKKMAKNMLIIGNGDVLSYGEVLEKHETYGVDGVMIGRGIFKNPYVFGKQPHELTKNERLDLFQKHFKLIEIYGGSVSSITKMYLKYFPGAKSERMLYNKS